LAGLSLAFPELQCLSASANTEFASHEMLYEPWICEPDDPQTVARGENWISFGVLTLSICRLGVDRLCSRRTGWILDAFFRVGKGSAQYSFKDFDTARYLSHYICISHMLLFAAATNFILILKHAHVRVQVLRALVMKIHIPGAERMSPLNSRFMHNPSKKPA
jgi:hypothetical protein